MNLKNNLIKGVAYTASAKYLNVFINIVIGAILARLLTPEEFGIVAIVTVFVTFFNLMSDFGIGPAVIQNQSLNDNDTSSIFSFSILVGITFAGLFYFAAPLIADFYNEEALYNVTRLLSLAVLFYSLQIVPAAVLKKKLRFKVIGIITVLVQVVSGTTAIYMAYAGYSYYSLVFKSVLDSLLTLIIFYYICPIRVSIKIEKKSISKIINFSSYQFLFNFINYFSRNMDNLLIGKYFGTASLGYYDKSYRLMMLPVSNLTHVITPVLMPILSKIQNDKSRVYYSYLKVVKLLSCIGFPLSILLFFSSEEIVNIVYGSQWEESIPVFKLLALSVGIQMVLSSSGSIFQAIDRTKLMFFSGLLSSITMIAGILAGIFIGETLESVAYGLIIAFIINFIQSFYLLIKISLNKSMMPFLKTFILPLSMSIGVFVVLYLLNMVSINADFVKLILNGFFSVLVAGMIFLIPLDNRLGVKKYLSK